MNHLPKLLNQLWIDYQALNPDVRATYELLRHEGEDVLNDHIALRTFDDPKVNVAQLAKAFVDCGYTSRDHYTFPEKRLEAWYFQHPDASLPKVFISELQTSSFSQEFQDLVQELIRQVGDGLSERWDFPVRGRPWKVSFERYERLRSESEYAAWVSAFGFRANHFTVDVNALKGYRDLQSLNEMLKAHGFRLNTKGGEIKGTPAVFLEQSSIMANEIPVDFTDGTYTIPACYYEFAKRYPLPSGELYQGFVTSSADKIFESTYKESG